MWSAAIGLILTAITIPAQIGLVMPESFSWKMFVGAAALAGVAWTWSLCLLSRSRGYHALWGLILLIPVFILFYPWFFPNKLKNKI
jgi:hypothetical protein